MPSDITVVVTTIRPRIQAGLLARALASVGRQTLQPDTVVISEDTAREGAAVTRQRGTARVTTSLVAYLDDDDEFGSEHLARCHQLLVDTGADLVYPWFDVAGGGDPFPMIFGREFDPDKYGINQIPVTFLARTAAIRGAGGWTEGWDPALAENPGTDEYGNRAGEDYMLTCRMVAAGARIVHLPERTWTWHHDSGNTSGLPSRVPWGAGT